MSTDDLSLRPATAGDAAAICALLAAVFPDNPKQDPALLSWQFWDNPYGDAASWVWEDRDGRLLGHFALFPIAGWLDGTATTFGKPADAATHPDHRGRGLFVRAARAAVEELAGRGVPLTMCMPNDDARPGMERVGMQPLDGVAAYVRPRDPAWLAGRTPVPASLAAAGLRMLPDLADVDGGHVAAGTPPDLDGLWEPTRRAVRAGTRRDRAWWGWRYDSHPAARYLLTEVRRDGRLVAACAATVREAFGGPVLHVLDLLARDRPAARAAVGAAVREAPHAVAVGTVARPGTRIARLARAAGLLRVPGPLAPKRFNFGILPHDEAAAATVRRDWTVVWGDLDHL